MPISYWKGALQLLICLGILACSGIMSPAGYAREAVLTVGVEGAPKTLDPRYATDATGIQISHNLLFSTLVTLGPDLRIIPRLAERWDVPDSQTYVFHLKKGVRFHDGKPLTAEDVKFTFEHLKDKTTKSVFAGVYKSIQSIRAIDAHTVAFKLEQGDASFLTDVIMPILPKHLVANGEDFPGKLVGSGPFTFVSQSPNEIVLAGNADFFKGTPLVEKVVIKVIKDDNTRFLKMRKGDLDLAINSMPRNKVNDFKKPPLNKLYQVVENPGLSYGYLIFNMNDPHLRDTRVRQAIAYGINIKEIIKYRLEGHAVHASGLLFSENWFAEPDVKKYAYDPEMAKKLLDSAGLKDPDGDGPRLRIALEMKTSTNPEVIGVARILQAQLGKIGIKLAVKSYEWGTFYGDIKKGNFQLTSMRWIGVTEPDFYFDIFHSSMAPPNGRNRGRYGNPALDRLLEQGRVELNAEKRKRIYSRVQKAVALDLPYISLWHLNNISIVHRRVSGYQQDPLGGFLSFYKIRVNP